MCSLGGRNRLPGFLRGIAVRDQYAYVLNVCGGAGGGGVVTGGGGRGRGYGWRGEGAGLRVAGGGGVVTGGGISLSTRPTRRARLVTWSVAQHRVELRHHSVDSRCHVGQRVQVFHVVDCGVDGRRAGTLVQVQHTHHCVREHDDTDTSL